ncbi:hypothetical protein ACHAXS_011612 [Conticribra weissflogii]
MSSRYLNYGSVDEEVITGLQKNDPSIQGVKLVIDQFTSSLSSRDKAAFERAGKAIARSTTLETLIIEVERPTITYAIAKNLVRFFKEVNKNKSIRNLELDFGRYFSSSGEDVIKNFINLLKSFLENNDLLKSFRCSMGRMLESDINILMTFLSCRATPLDEIQLRGCGLGYYEIHAIFSFFTKYPQMCPKKFNLDNDNNGWEESANLKITYFVKAFSHFPDLVPSSLGFVGNGFGSKTMAELCGLLATRTTPMERLELQENNIGNYGLLALLESFKTNPRVSPKVIDVRENEIERIGSVEMRPVIALLREPQCLLEKLIMGNRQPEWRWETHRKDIDTSEVHGDVWISLASALCDRSSISSTYASNHTFVSFGSVSYIPTRIGSYLSMNKNPNKATVACIKVVRNHFASNFDLDLFKDVHYALLARVLCFVHRGFNELVNGEFQVGSERGSKSPEVECDDESSENLKDSESESEGNDNNSLTIHYLVLKANPSILIGPVSSRKRKLTKN